MAKIFLLLFNKVINKNETISNMHIRKNFIIILFLISAFIIQPIAKASEPLPIDESLQVEETQTLQGRAANMELISDYLDYFPESQQFVATGNAEVTLKEEGSKLKADKIIFNQDDQTILAIGHVRILKNNMVVTGDYTKIEMTKNSALISHPVTNVDVLNIKAKTANVYSDKIEALKGSASVSKYFEMPLSTNKNAGEFDTNRMFKYAKEKKAGKKSSYKIVSKEMTVIGKDDRKIIQIRNATVYAGKFKIAYIPFLEISTNEDMTQIETMLPEVGSKQALGAYLGPGFVSYLPHGATLKTAPIVTMNKGGIGLLARLKTSKSRSEIAYSTGKKNVVLEGEYNFSKTLKLNYAQNEYLDDGIMGLKKPNLGADLVYHKVTDLKDLGLYHSNRISAGYAQDYESRWGTGRYRCQGELVNKLPLWHYKDYINLRTTSQYDVTLYGNGDTTGIFRIGPRVDSEVGPFNFYAAYFVSGVHGQSPMLFDRYTYGKTTLQFRGEYYVNRYLSLAYLTYLNMAKDYDNKLLAENQLFVSAGPEDIKVRFGFDTIRKRVVYGVDMLVGTDRTAFEFDKLNVINPDKVKKPEPVTDNKKSL
jgi:hypothetical protein